MFGTFRNALRISDLRRRIFFTFWMFVILRLGAHVPVPGVNTNVIADLFREGTLWGWLDMFSGGAFKAFSVFAMNVTPYITASIIVQLLTVVIPAWEEMSKEGGQEGRKKLNEYTRYGTVALGLVQAYGMAYGLRTAIINTSFWSITMIALTLTAGTAFLMWLGEQITEHGIGNGISLIIFAGIVSRLPAGTGKVVTYISAGKANWVNVIILAIVGAFVIAAVVWMQEGQRRIPVQYAKRVVGRKVYGGQSTHIPMRVNAAGVIPVIFASSVLLFPVTIAQFFPANRFAGAILPIFNVRTPLYTALYALFTVFFTYFYTAITFNPVEVSNNIKKYGGFIPGLRPGKPTADYLARVLERITLAGSIFLAAIAALLPGAVVAITRLDVWLGGTALLIVVGVALETMKQIEAHLIMRHYQGFMR